MLIGEFSGRLSSCKQIWIYLRQREVCRFNVAYIVCHMFRLIVVQVGQPLVDNSRQSSQNSQDASIVVDFPTKFLGSLGCELVWVGLGSCLAQRCTAAPPLGRAWSSSVS